MGPSKHRAASPTVLIPTLDDRKQLLDVWIGAPRQELAACLDRGDGDGFDRALLAYLRGRRSPRFFFDSQTVSLRAAEILRDSPDKTARVMAHADEILAGK